MKRLSVAFSVVGALALSIFATACSTTQSKENMLATAGFRAVSASTPKQQQLLASLQPGKISTIVRDGKTYYVYPDAKNNLAYVGTQKEYTTYRQLVFAQNISDQNLEAAQLNQQAMMGWGAWGGGWGGMGWR
jgi:hypothetical protein